MKDYMKLVYSRRGDHYLLFDMQNDPMEERDLSTDPQYKATYEELKTLLYEHIKTTVPQVLDDTGELLFYLHHHILDKRNHGGLAFTIKTTVLIPFIKCLCT